MKYLTFWSDDPHPNSAAIYIYIHGRFCCSVNYFPDLFVVKSSHRDQ
jgi:hypothetical protein